MSHKTKRTSVEMNPLRFCFIQMLLQKLSERSQRPICTRRNICTKCNNDDKVLFLAQTATT
jgi:hypothetical protein